MEYLHYIGFLTLLNFNVANEYCNICKTHTMCRYEKDIIPENCTDYKKIELTTENKTDIVDIHNNLRNFVASGGYVNESDVHFPEAAAMIYLKWSDELAVQQFQIRNHQCAPPRILSMNYNTMLWGASSGSHVNVFLLGIIYCAFLVFMF